MGDEHKIGHGTFPRTPPQILSMPKAFEADLKEMRENNYRLDLPVVLHVTLLKSPQVKDADIPLKDWIGVTDSVLAAHNITVNYHPVSKIPITLKTSGNPLKIQDDIAEIRQAAHISFQDNAAPPRLPIIICEFSRELREGTAGLTKVNQAAPPDGRVQLSDGTTWLPFVLLPTGDPVADNATMVHEIAHSTMLTHGTSGGDNLNILNDNLSLDRTQFVRRHVNKFQLRRIARAYFALPKLVVK